MLKEIFYQEFLAEFNSHSAEPPGDASLTRIERVSLRYALELTGGNEVARRYIIENGLPLLRDAVGPRDLGETAYRHICVVAAYLNDTRGIDAAPDTVESYITKNRFDRWFHLQLVREGRMGVNSDIEQAWDFPQDRQQGYENTAQVQYPYGVDGTKIYGVAKPHRYWPAQTARYLEFIRLGKVDSQDERDRLGLVNGQEWKYEILWQNFRDVVRFESSLDGMTVGIAIKTMEILSNRDLDNDQVIKLVLAGYSPGGIMNEHGNIPQVHELWSGIVNRVEFNQTLSPMKDELLNAVTEKMDKQGYPFLYNPTLII